MREQLPTRSEEDARGGPLRLLVLTEDLGGGTGNHFVSMLRRWDPARIDVRIVSHGANTARRLEGVRLEAVASSGRLDRFPLAQLRRLAQAHRRVGTLRPDLVHAFFFWSIVYGRVIKRLGRVRVLVENREDMGFSWGRAEYALLRATRSVPDRVVCVSHAVRNVVLEREGLDPARTVVIHNGVEPPPEPPPDGSRMRRELGIARGDPVVGMVSSLNRPVKGVEYFIEAAPRILREVPAALLLILGDGPLAPALRERARALGVDSRVCFAGFRSDVDECYAAMDVSAMTSLSEGLSIALLESMRHGLPVVATDVGGNPELIVEGETGHLVPARDVERFAEKVVSLLRDPARQRAMGQAARRRVREHFALEDVTARYLELYESLVRRG